MKFSQIFLSKLLMLSFISLLSLNVYAEDYAGVNLKFFNGYINSNVNYLDKINYFFEVETMAKKGRWDVYGFTDLKLLKKEADKVNYDFYKYIARYDVLNNSKLYLVAEAKETYNYTGDAFIGLGTSFNLPALGSLNINGMYFLSQKDKIGSKANLPLMLQFSWFNNFGKIKNSEFSLYHGGWSDVDIFEKRKNLENTNISWQAYEGIGVNYGTYGFELGYKYWLHVSNSKHNANSIFIYLIKRF